jgi:phage terminase large subunit
VKTSWHDNPALSDELRTEIEHLKATDPDEYAHVYEGMCRQCRAQLFRQRNLVSPAQNIPFAPGVGPARSLQAALFL